MTSHYRQTCDEFKLSVRHLFTLGGMLGARWLRTSCGWRCAQIVRRGSNEFSLSVLHEDERVHLALAQLDAIALIELARHDKQAA